jgi:hypothetical protein
MEGSRPLSTCSIANSHRSGVALRTAISCADSFEQNVKMF